jgi:hypothetical protein
VTILLISKQPIHIMSHQNSSSYLCVCNGLPNAPDKRKRRFHAQSPPACSGLGAAQPAFGRQTGEIQTLR